MTLYSAGRGNIDIAVNVVGPTVQKKHRRTIGAAGLGVPNIQEAGVDLLSAPNDVLVPGLIGGTVAEFGLLDCAATESKPSWAAAMVMATVPKNRRMPITS